MVYLPSHWTKRLMLAAGLSVSSLSLLVLIGWQIHSLPLIQIFPDLAPMQRMTALGFLLSGIALLFLSTRRKWVAGLCGLAVFILAVAVLLEYILGADFGIDQLLGHDYINVHTSNPGRMSPVTGICFLGCSLALLVAASRRLAGYASAIVGILSSMLVAVGTVSVLGYLLGRTATYGWTQFARMALHTSAAFALVGIGLLAWAWHESRTKISAPRWLPLSIGLSLAAGALGVWQGLMAHEESKLPLLSGIILAGGLLAALLVAVAVFQTQQAQQRSRESAEGKEFLERLFEASPDILLLTNQQGRIVQTNQRIAATFGYTPGELIGQSVEMLVPEKLRALHEDHRKNYFAAPETRTMGQSLDLHARRKDGSEFPAEIALSPVQTAGELHVLAVVRDTTDRKRAEEALRQSEERFRSLFEQGPIGVALLRMDRRIIKANSEFCRMLGYSEQELAGMTPRDITHPEDQDASAELMKGLFENDMPISKVQKRYVKKTGEIMWGSLSAAVIRDPQGRPLYGVGMVEDITARKRAEQKLAQQAALLDLAHDAVIVRDLESRVAFWSRGAADTYGWSAEEARGRVTHELLQTSFPVPLQQIQAAVLTQGAWEGELQHTTKNGKNIIVASRWSLQRDERGRPSAVLEINRDITQRKRAEEKLQTQTERLSLATRSASIGIWDWDLRSNQSVWDDTMFAMFGIPRVVPMPYENFERRVHPEDLSKVEASLQRAIQGKTQDFVEFRIIRADGSVRHIYSAEGVVLDEHGTVVRVVGTAVDITERKQMEAQIEAGKAQLVAAARLSALGMMAGGVAHEINSPLAIIHALASDLEDIVKEEGAAPPETVRRNSTRIIETTDRIASIVRSLLQISREGSGDRFFRTRIGKVVEQTLAICRERFRANGVTLLLPREMPDLNVMCREVQIEQVLLNLLQNAFDAVVDQPGERWVRLDVDTCDDSVVISVTDSGPGIPPELRSRIMEPFFTTKPVGKGTGLGLSVSKTIAEEHGGGLQYSEYEGHTRFSLALPLAKETQAAWV